MWLAVSLRRPDALRVAPYVQALLRLTGRAVGVPATVLSLLTGVGLVYAGEFSWLRSTWILAALALYSIAGAVWHWGLIPLRVRMGLLAAAREAGLPGDVGPGGLVDTTDADAEYGRLARRWLRVKGVILALLAAILALMVWKPVFP